MLDHLFLAKTPDDAGTKYLSGETASQGTTPFTGTHPTWS